LGRYGEDLAAAWYEERGYRILERNWRCREGEIDLVCASESLGRRAVLVVVEVKARTTASHGHPLEAVTPAKQRRLRRLAGAYLRSRPRRVFYDHVRFDVAAVTGRSLLVIESAF
jgi:putative endonuclease